MRNGNEIDMTDSIRSDEALIEDTMLSILQFPFVDHIFSFEISGHFPRLIFIDIWPAANTVGLAGALDGRNLVEFPRFLSRLHPFPSGLTGRADRLFSLRWRRDQQYHQPSPGR